MLIVTERVVTEGEVATAATYAHLFSSLPSCGRPTRLIVYDLHTLQNRFYLHGNTVASLHTTVPCLIPRLEAAGIDAVAFPDDGAHVPRGDSRRVRRRLGQVLGQRVVVGGEEAPGAL